MIITQRQWWVFGTFIFGGTMPQNSRRRAVSTTDSWKKSRLNFSQRTHPIIPVWPKTHVRWVFGTFIFGGTVPKNSRRRAVLTIDAPKKSRLNFSQRAHPIISVWPKTHVWWVFGTFISDETAAQNLRGMVVFPTDAPKNSQLNFSERTHPIISIWPPQNSWGRAFFRCISG